VTIRDVRVNDFYYDDDAPLIGASVDGNYNCSEYGGTNCCFCLPNGVRSTQVAVWVPLARSNGSSATATRNLIVENLVSRSTQADGVNLHGLVRDAVVANVRIESTGDDAFAVWGGDQPAAGLRFTRGCVAVNPGVLRPNWYGNCVATCKCLRFTSPSFDSMLSMYDLFCSLLTSLPLYLPPDHPVWPRYLKL
jgi:hypothetical protein